MSTLFYMDTSVSQFTRWRKGVDNRPLTFGALTAVSALGVTPTARAEGFPAHPVTIIVPFATGGPTDILARIMAEGMSRDLGQPVIIENTPGAGGTVGTARAARAAGLCRIGY